VAEKIDKPDERRISAAAESKGKERRCRIAAHTSAASSAGAGLGFVVDQTGSARSYARSVARLHDLRWSAGTRLLAPGILGRKSSLGDRIELLLRRGREFSARPLLASLGVSALLLALLLGAGSLIPSWIAIAQTKEALPAAKFEVASINPDKSGRDLVRIIGAPHEGRFYATGATLKLLIILAYDTDDWRILGGPKWINSERFDIEAKADTSLNEELKKLNLDQAWFIKDRMLQELLADRFKLKVHSKTRELPVYVLVVAKKGPKLEVAREEGPTSNSDNSRGSHGVVRAVPTGGRSQQLSFQDEPISSLTACLSGSWVAAPFWMRPGSREDITSPSSGRRM
jgi:uncharacterized protein (TIGR03435 family)